jgi:DNA-binding response OmpR family regulator
MSIQILIVEDDPDIAELVARYLHKAGYATSRAASGRDALRSIAAQAPDLVVLDLMLPHVDGLEVCRAVRANEGTAGIPIIMLTARAEESERIVGLELGADDYLAKPFSPRELLARMRAVLRRAMPDPERERVVAGDIVIDVPSREVKVAGRAIELTGIEFDLLVALARRAGRVVPRDAILSLAGRDDVVVGERTVDVHISHLRAKLGDDPKSPRRIKTVRGVGYMLTREGGG